MKRKLYQNEDETSKIKKEMLKLEELNLELMKEISHLKKQLQGGSMQGSEMKKFKPEEDYVIKDQNFKLMSTNTRDSSYLRMLELKNENISCWKRDKCDLFEYQNTSLNLINTFKFSVNWDKISEFLFPIKIGKHTIFTDGENKINIWDKKYKLIQTITEGSKITCLYNIKYKEFAAGFNYGGIHI